MKNRSNRNPAKNNSQKNVVDKKQLLALSHKNSPNKISNVFAQKHHTHHGPLLNMRRPHVPHG